jgi:hypothetical protein
MIANLLAGGQVFLEWGGAEADPKRDLGAGRDLPRENREGVRSVGPVSEPEEIRKGAARAWHLAWSRIRAALEGLA